MILAVLNAAHHRSHIKNNYTTNFTTEAESVKAFEALKLPPDLRKICVPGLFCYMCSVLWHSDRQYTKRGINRNYYSLIFYRDTIFRCRRYL